MQINLTKLYGLLLVIGLGLLLTTSIALAQTKSQTAPAVSTSFNAEKLMSAHIQKNAVKWQLTSTDVADILVTDHFTSRHNGLTHIYLRQRYQGIDISQATANANYTKDGKLLSFNQSFIPNLATAINQTQASLSAKKAVKYAAQHLQLNLQEKLTVLDKKGGAAKAVLFSDGGISLEGIPVKLEYRILNEQDLRLCWNVRIYETDYQNWWEIYVDATTGEVHDKFNWVVHCNFDATPHNHGSCITSSANQQAQQHQHHAISAANAACSNINLPKPSPTPSPLAAMPASGDYNVFAMPVESPNHGSRSIVNSPWLDAPNASPFGWHDTNGVNGAEHTNTRGNNVWAQEDRNGNDGTGTSPSSATLDYNFPLNFANSPTANQDASLTNLFYWNNIMHDVWYEYGFDEISGNFQANNYGNGGVGGDYVFADGQDGSGLNNANFSSPPDGSNPRMQMFEWSAGSTLFITVNSPSNIAGSYQAVEAAFGPGLPITPSNITGNVVIANDGSGAPTEACNALSNGGAINGNIALIDRGNCNFTDKVLNAQNEGAVAVIMCNNVAGAPISMGAGTGGGAGITIPSVMISQADCNTIRLNLPSSITLTKNNNNNNIDGDFDNGIVAHEYGHGISIRLTGGAATNACLTNEEQMGEGWSDWLGLMLTMEAGDAATDIRGIGTYAVAQPTNAVGIRNAPYTTDMLANPYTYANLGDGDIIVPHGVGFVWATMLWDMTWALIDVHGFDPDIYSGNGGNNIAMQLVIDGMKIQPCNPGFVDGRDAILQADQVNYNGANQCIIWEAFAGRGLGFSASQGNSNSKSDGTAATDLPPTCDNVLLVTKTADATVSAGSTLTYTLNITNNTGGSLSNVTINDVLPSGTTFVNGSSSCGGSASGGTLNISVGTMANGTVKTCTYDVLVASTPSSNILLADDMENGTNNWTTSSGAFTQNWAQSNAASNSTNTSWFANDIDDQSDQYLTLANPITIAGSSPQLRFWHSYDTEATWDGGVVEISTNGGGAWSDLGGDIIQNGYNSVIATNDASAISDRDAFTGNSLGFIETVVDLSAYTGQGVLIRFRFASDAFVGGTGWFVDDVMIVDAVTITNNMCVNAPQLNQQECADATTLVLGASTTTPLPVSIEKTASATTTTAGSTLTYTLTISNPNATTLNSVVVTDVLPSGVTFLLSSTTCNIVQLAGNLNLSLGNMAGNAVETCTYDVVVDSAPFSNVFLEDDMELGNNDWSIANAGSAANWALTTGNANSGTTSWYAEDIDSSSDQYLTTTPILLTGANPELRFWHFYDTEATWDGGVVEISTDGGSNWTDLGSDITQNGYNAVIQTNPASAITDREAFTGASGGYIETIVDLSAYVNQNIQIRFRFATDGLVGGDGWYIDDVILSDVYAITNTACATSSVPGSNCDDATVVITQGSCSTAPSVNAGTNVSGCDGLPITLNASSTGGSGTISYAWSNGATTASTNVAPLSTTNYTVTATDNNGCSSIDEVLVTIFSNPIANAGADQTICLGQSATLTADGGGNYSWTSGATTATTVVAPTSTTSYTVIVTNTNNCFDLDEVTVFVEPAPIADAGTDQSICEGDSANLTASGGTAYNWTTGDTMANISVSPSTTTTYTVIVTDDNNCFDTAEVTVNVVPAPTANAGADVTICAGEDATLTANGGVSYNWSSGDNTTSTTVSPTSTSTYTVTVTDANYCQNTDNVTVNIDTDANCNFTIVKIKALLEGPMNPVTETMSTQLLTSELLPTQQPYNTAPWNYSGGESVSSLNVVATNVTDWVILEIRDGNNSTIIIEQHAAFMLNNGDIVDIDGITDGVKFYNLLASESYYAIVRHRNHIDIMSAELLRTIDDEMAYDFTVNLGQAIGFNQLGAVGTKAVMHEGDMDGNGVITFLDFNRYANQTGIVNSYEAGDLNLDGNVTIDDFNGYFANASLIGIDFIRY